VHFVVVYGGVPDIDPDKPQEVKSLITQPSLGLTLKAPGHYEISGIAYSGTGGISRSWFRPMVGIAGPKQRSRSRC
jgi:hypothetical protein